jgi:hypothetical protein
MVLKRSHMMETLYKTNTPKPSNATEQYFELSLGEQTVDGQLGYFVRETHGWWDEATKRIVRVQYTLSPRAGFASVEEASDRYNRQRIERARRGFMHSFTPRWETSQRSKYVRIDISPQENIDEKAKDEG